MKLKDTGFCVNRVDLDRINTFVQEILRTDSTIKSVSTVPNIKTVPTNLSKLPQKIQETVVAKSVRTTRSASNKETTKLSKKGLLNIEGDKIKYIYEGTLGDDALIKKSFEQTLFTAESSNVNNRIQSMLEFRLYQDKETFTSNLVKTVKSMNRDELKDFFKNPDNNMKFRFMKKVIEEDWKNLHILFLLTDGVVTG